MNRRDLNQDKLSRECDQQINTKEPSKQLESCDSIELQAVGSQTWTGDSFHCLGNINDGDDWKEIRPSPPARLDASGIHNHLT
jgi:hypothetical protein